MCDARISFAESADNESTSQIAGRKLKTEKGLEATGALITARQAALPHLKFII
jgi:hypothetical protein